MTPTEMRDAPTEEEMKAAIERLKWFAAACRKPVEADDERFGDYISGDDGGAAADIDLLLSVQPSRPQGDWQPIETAPKDGTHILAFCVHANFDVAPPEDRARWTEIVITCWIDFNGGGWTWNGICGVHTHWMPLPEPPALSRNPQQGEGS